MSVNDTYLINILRLHASCYKLEGEITTIALKSSLKLLFINLKRYLKDLCIVLKSGANYF